MRNKQIILLAGLALVAVFVFAGLKVLPEANQRSETQSQKSDTKKYIARAVMYKDPNCGCCEGHAKALEKAGIKVVLKNISAKGLNQIKQKHKIPFNKQSCHTLEMEGYFIEGHVPIEAIKKLLTEKPKIDGISLPGMPIGTPGMPGPKMEEWVIYQSKDGEFSEFMRI